MSWNPIVIGVDGSPEGTAAASLGAELAERAATRYQLVHAVRDLWLPSGIEPVAPAFSYGEAVIAEAGARVRRALSGAIDPAAVDRTIVRAGRPAVVLGKVVTELGAAFVVLGGKHHSVLDRWLAGSTSIDVVRTSAVPVLIAGAARGMPKRVLAAVDTSPDAARATIAAAERLAAFVGAEVRVVSVLEPLPIVPDVPNYDLTTYYAMLEDHLTREIWPLVRTSGARKVSRYGRPGDEIAAEVAEWSADLLVVGSHGKDWIDRLLIGSVTEALLNHLPTSMLVVPLKSTVRVEEPAPAAQFAMA
ncbi:MAG TPA: universal stress protein [Gemmatimonadales bacterium]|nr:universal stress protein [Gemmatimonadales bacterium]